MKKVRLGIFISGGGSNAKKLVEYFDAHEHIEVCKIISNNFHTPLITDERTKKIVECVSSEDMTASDAFFERCKTEFDYIILAGYLKLIPQKLIANFENRIINVHPAILPNYGGKGMYGMNVHRAIFENKEKQSGITIHFIDKEYDKGSYIAQLYTTIQQCQSPEEIQKAVQILEHTYFPIVIEKTILNRL
jgi:phosphoribosylglycinamide formyltransferase-1